jgi:hypothetical protein
LCNPATFLSRVITGEESWVYGCDTDNATILPTKPTHDTEKGKKVKSKVRSILIFVIKGTDNKQFGLAGQIVNSTYHCDVLR